MENSENYPILVAGAGSWGTALAIVLARNDHKVYLWDIASEHIRLLQEERVNSRYLPGIELPELLVPVTNFTDHLKEVKDVVIAVPCNSLRDILKVLANNSHTDLNICLACKGLETGTQKLNHQVVQECLGDIPTAVLSGPSFAREVAQGLPTAVTIASGDIAIAEHFADYFHNDVFRIYTHDDIVGVQVGGAVKNIMAIAAGIADGLGFGANTRAALITRGLVEIIRLGVALGGRQETFMGLAGLGDLVLTCTDDQSRNRRLGLLLAKGKNVDDALREIDQVVEGVRTASEVMKLSKKYQIEMPISEQVFNVLHGDTSPADAVQMLLSRDPKPELQ
ncbi:MAG: glycerol-3-phosphate dehydrogenase [Gammaproteobacteria bacterium]|nr:glycerol-3-phosphate dehydrogenase [Gammaproteobacteria bacterium]